MNKYSCAFLQFRLLHIINICWKRSTVPDEWKKAKVISLFKKRDRAVASNYKGISLLSITYKIYGKIVKERLRSISNVLLREEQLGFRKRRPCIGDLCSLKMLIEKRREFNLEMHLAFIDYEKVFHRVNKTIYAEHNE